ncbi:MAG: hypothetical protein IIZ91_00275, partial [Oscillospiraceae bacterium]|nr:hypothetical protein [Oscillospiraceae bacterium]
QRKRRLSCYQRIKGEMPWKNHKHKEKAKVGEDREKSNKNTKYGRRLYAYHNIGVNGSDNKRRSPESAGL